jgi:hypothetical protein
VQSALLTCAVLTVLLSMPPVTTWLFNAGQQTTARSVPVQQAER